jgi:protein-S-isoprenylcysteine O-methyltransferase Ste14
MWYLLRHLVSVAILPGTAVVLVPAWVARRYRVQPSWPNSLFEWMLVFAGVAVVVPGVLLFFSSLRQFFSTGKGTLAPWDPPRRFVVTGPYRYVRNPMISGVIFMLFGLALLLRSTPHAAWAGTFVLLNAIYIPLFEEPDLARRFGPDYDEYRTHVRRFLPRLTPWKFESQRLSP